MLVGLVPRPTLPHGRLGKAMFEKVGDASFIKGEHEVLKFWEQNGIFDKLRQQNAGKPKWNFLDGPITANNPMGVHHAWGRTYKDAYQRYYAMTGHELRYQNGFDCQGLWVEVEVEKPRRMRRTSMSAPAHSGRHSSVYPVHGTHPGGLNSAASQVSDSDIWIRLGLRKTSHPSNAAA